MFGSPAMSKDLNLPFAPNSFKQGRDESDLRTHHHQQQQHYQQQEQQEGLLRYRSAPTTFLGEVCEETMFGRHVAADQSRGNRGERKEAPPPPPPPGITHHPSLFHSLQQPQQIPGINGSSSESPYLAMNSIGMDQEQPRGGTGTGTGATAANLSRQNSSPANFFSHLTSENGFAVMRGMGGGGGGFRPVGSSSTGGGRLKTQLSFTSQMSEIESDSMGGTGSGSSPEEGGRCYIQGHPVAAASWEDPVMLSGGGFGSGSKRVRDPSEFLSDQGGDVRGGHGHPVTALAHHMSLPKASSEMASMENFLQFQDAVPCKFRAKRGCATHPRSIAERMRRTKISEKMRKLQELVPNMDKQMNTSDMLELAVDHIKDLQRRVRVMTESQSSCTCSEK